MAAFTLSKLVWSDTFVMASTMELMLLAFSKIMDRRSATLVVALASPSMVVPMACTPTRPSDAFCDDSLAALEMVSILRSNSLPVTVIWRTAAAISTLLEPKDCDTDSCCRLEPAISIAVLLMPTVTPLTSPTTLVAVRKIKVPMMRIPTTPTKRSTHISSQISCRKRDRGISTTTFQSVIATRTKA